jgi:16S rRNA (cytosine967-C5)-methyltransferase
VHRPSPPAPAALPLSRLLVHTAEAVQAVRAGRSLTEALARCPAAARPGTQALAFEVLRRLGTALALRTRLVPKAPPAAQDALLLSALALLWAGDGPSDETAGADAPPRYAPHTLVDQAVQAARERQPASAGFFNAVLRRCLRERQALAPAIADDPLARHGHPAWWVERLRADWPDHWQALLAANDRRPPMTLRVNLRQGTVDAYLARLAEAGLAARPLPLPGGVAPPAASAAVLLERPVPVTRLPGFADGAVSVQDAAAQVAAHLLLADAPGLAPLPEGARVLDACAAPGGKTAQLLEQSAGPIELLAIDRDATRLARVDDSLRRLRLGARTRAADAGEPATWWDGRPFDAILLDAPCSASGIVRRHPDVRWLRRPADLDTLAATQARLLDALWTTLAPGGRLVYCTCSVFKAEGQDQIAAFLQRRPDAAAAPGAGSPGHLLPLADNPDDGSDPVRPACDGFYLTLLVKAA